MSHQFDERGAATEYALLVSLIAVACAGTITLLGERVQTIFDTFYNSVPW